MHTHGGQLHVMAVGKKMETMLKIFHDTYIHQKHNENLRSVMRKAVCAWVMKGKVAEEGNDPCSGVAWCSVTVT